jgi:type II secretory pathway component PulF
MGNETVNRILAVFMNLQSLLLVFYVLFFYNNFNLQRRVAENQVSFLALLGNHKRILTVIVWERTMQFLLKYGIVLQKKILKLA